MLMATKIGTLHVLHSRKKSHSVLCYWSHKQHLRRTFSWIPVQSVVFVIIHIMKACKTSKRIKQFLISTQDRCAASRSGRRPSVLLYMRLAGTEKYFRRGDQSYNPALAWNRTCAIWCLFSWMFLHHPSSVTCFIFLNCHWVAGIKVKCSAKKSESHFWHKHKELSGQTEMILLPNYSCKTASLFGVLNVILRLRCPWTECKYSSGRLGARWLYNSIMTFFVWHEKVQHIKWKLDFVYSSVVVVTFIGNF